MEKQPFAYGVSSPVLDSYTIELLRNITPSTVVDIGAGAGKYGKICRNLFGDSIHITAVDGYPKTCEHLKQIGVYNNVETLLVDQWISQELAGQKEKVDLIICGDVLEHLTRRHCFRAIDNFLRLAETVLILVPLRNVEQEAQVGNVLEIHKAYLLDADFERRYIIGEKHSSMSLQWHMFSAWILARKKNRLNDWIKTQQLRWGGHNMFRLMKHFHINTKVETDYFMPKAFDLKHPNDEKSNGLK